MEHFSYDIYVNSVILTSFYFDFIEKETQTLADFLSNRLDVRYELQKVELEEVGDKTYTCVRIQYNRLNTGFTRPVLAKRIKDILLSELKAWKYYDTFDVETIPVIVDSTFVCFRGTANAETIDDVLWIQQVGPLVIISCRDAEKAEELRKTLDTLC